MKIIDCFLFYNETELLTYRLNILNNVVDYFVIVEATHTFAGMPKNCIFEQLKQTEPFLKFRDKIIHVIVDDFPYIYPNIQYAIYEEGGQQWQNEHHQRNCIARGLERLPLKNVDVITVTDVDEIPDPALLTNIKNKRILVTLNVLEMDFYYYNLNSKVRQQWHLAKIVSFWTYKEVGLAFQYYRHIRCPGQMLQRGGWHLSYFGDANYIKNKIENFSHQELNTREFTDTNKIEERVANCGDLFERINNPISKISVYHNNYLPPDCYNYLSTYIMF